MMIDNLEFKTLETKAEVKSAISFFNSVLSHKMDDKIWEWEFDSLPNTVLTIVKNDNDVVGSQFMLPVKLNVNGTELLSAKSESSHFDPAYRGKGLFPKLYAFAEEVSLKEKILFLWGFTSAVKVFEKSLKFMVSINIICDFSALVGIPDLGALRKNNAGILTAYKSYIYFLLNNIKYKKKYQSFSKKVKYAKLIPDYDVRQSLSSDGDMHKLYDNLRLQYGNFTHISFDKPYLDWRINNNPILNYVTRYFYKGGKLSGYYIFSLSQSSANIADFTALDTETSNVMICHLLNEVSELKALKLNYFGNIGNEINIKVFNLLKTFGGNIKANEGMQFVYKNIAASDSSDMFLRPPNNWYINGLWTEGFVY